MEVSKKESEAHSVCARFFCSLACSWCFGLMLERCWMLPLLQWSWSFVYKWECFIYSTRFCLVRIVCFGKGKDLPAYGSRTQIFVGFPKSLLKIVGAIPRRSGYQPPPKSVKVSRSVLAQTSLPSFPGTTPLYFLKPLVSKFYSERKLGGKGSANRKISGFSFSCCRLAWDSILSKKLCQECSPLDTTANQWFLHPLLLRAELWFLTAAQVIKRFTSARNHKRRRPLRYFSVFHILNSLYYKFNQLVYKKEMIT